MQAARPTRIPVWKEQAKWQKKANLDRNEEKLVDEHESVPSSVIFEAIRREGEHELLRPLSALWWSGVAAGLAISMSILCKGFFVSILPHEDWAAGISNLGYTVGFLIVILGRMQLFTENTITPILPLLLVADPDQSVSNGAALEHCFHGKPCRLRRRGVGAGVWAHPA